MSEKLSKILSAVKTGDNNMLLNLETIVAQLLENDPEKLMHALYRIDVDEKKFTAAMQGTTGNPAKDIALLLYQRVLEKAANKKNFIAEKNISPEEKW